MNIDISKYVELLKSYMSLLVPAVIAVAAIAFFVPTHLMSRNLVSTIKKESISQGTTVQSLSNSVVSAEQWNVERVYQEKHAADANMIEHFARQTTLRELLSYKIFPEPKDASVLIYDDFGSQFCGGIRDLVIAIGGGSCPSVEDLSRAKGDWNSSRGSRGRGSANKVSGTIEDSLCLEKAEACRVYVNPVHLSGYSFWQSYDY
jgi:hypothetical protein